MFEKLNETYGIKLCVSSERKVKGIPIYMVAGRKLYDVQYEGLDFLIVCVSDVDRFGSIALEKQLKVYQDAVDMPVAYAFDRLTSVQRAALIKRKIPYISEPDQIYLPFLGVMLQHNLNRISQYQTDQKMMPATQCVFLHLVYHGQNGYLKKEAADQLGLTRTSISRASEQLATLGLIKEERRGREIKMFPNGSGIKLFERAKAFLINPVQKVLYVKEDVKLKNCIMAGESALGGKTMLNRPGIPVYAISKNSKIVNQLQEVDPKWEQHENICMIELWKYDPELFALDGVVDPISLTMTFDDTDDERIEEALDEYMENYKW